jgi:hypothetical protein
MCILLIHSVALLCIIMALVNTRPHALMLPFPAQGHIQAMMQLSKILYARGFYMQFQDFIPNTRASRHSPRSVDSS